MYSCVYSVQVGAGFWLQDDAAVKVHAEALAKAKYAETRDPRSCAMLYAALGKKSLLQVRIAHIRTHSIIIRTHSII